MGKKQETGITGVENNINLEKNSNIIKRIVVFMFMFALSGVIAWLGSVLYHIQTDMMIRNIVMVLTGSGIVIFSYVMGETSGFFVYRNEGRYGRFAFIYLVSLTAAVFLPFLPVTGWPFLVLFVLLSVFSNSMTGLAAGSLGLLLAVNFAGCDYAIFWLYFISGMAGILVFATLDEDFRVGIPMVISLLVLSLCLTANVILFAKEQLSIAQFMIPGINLMVCCILLLVSLKMVSSMVIHRYRDRYMEINDPECPLLVQLKELSK